MGRYIALGIQHKRTISRSLDSYKDMVLEAKAVSRGLTLESLSIGEESNGTYM
jgi:hypothetical protein